MAPLNDPYPQLRPALAPRLQDAPPAQIRAELAAEGIDAEAVEGFFSDLGRAASSIGSAIAPRLGNIVQGAVQGAGSGAMLGPWGMLAGAALGGVSGGLSAPGRRPAGGRGAAGAGPLGALSGALGAMGGGAGIGGAAGTLFGLLNQPQVQQSLLAMLLGRSGSSTVPVAGQNVPVAAIPNMIAHFAQQAAAEWEHTHGVPATETLAGLHDSADSAERAQALAQAIAVDAIMREAVAEQESEWSEWHELNELEATDADAHERDEGYGPIYEPVYAR